MFTLYERRLRLLMDRDSRLALCKNINSPEIQGGTNQLMVSVYDKQCIDTLSPYHLVLQNNLTECEKLKVSSAEFAVALA